MTGAFGCSSITSLCDNCDHRCERYEGYEQGRKHERNIFQSELLEEIENKIQQFIFQHIEEYGVDIVEGNAEALDDLKVWLAEKKVEVNNYED